MPKLFSSFPRWLLILVVICLLLALALAFDWLPILRGGEVFHWQWPYVPAPLVRALPLIFALSVYLAGLALLWRRAFPALMWAFLGAALLPLTVILVHFDNPLYELFVRTASGVATGPHLAAAEIDWSSPAWHNWTAVMHSYSGRSVHVLLSPPGLPLWYGLLNAILGAFPGAAEALQRVLLPAQCQNYAMLQYTPAEWASAWFGILMPLWAALTVFPLYGVARRLGIERGTALKIVAWYPLIPALIMYTPSWNTLYPLLAVIAFWLLLVGLERGAGWLVASGVAFGLLTFANFSMIPLGGLLGFYTLLHYLWNERPTRRLANDVRSTRPIIVGVWFALGTILPWALYWLAARGTPLEMLRASLDVHLDLDRPYVPWLWFHSWEWALFTGIPLIALWLAAAVGRIRHWRDPGPVLPLALLLTMIVLVLSGTARGETGRVWLFFAPFVLLAAGEYLASSVGTRHAVSFMRAWFVITLAQTALLLALAITWSVIDAPDIKPPPAPPVQQAARRPAGAVYGGQFRLVGWDASVDKGGIELRLNWQALNPMTVPYWFGAILVYPDGHSVPNAVVWQPQDTRYPTTCWQPGALVSDTVRVPLPPNAPSGNWWISLASFADDQATQVLSVRMPDGSSEQQVGLGPIAVP
jgi:hypothetical protein